MKGVACLDIQDPVPEDAGVYECVASNPSGVARTEVLVPGQLNNLFNIYKVSYFKSIFEKNLTSKIDYN